MSSTASDHNDENDDDDECGPSATWQKYCGLWGAISHMPIREKRRLYQQLRKSPTATHDTFLTHFGCTAGQFAVAQLYYEGRKRRSVCSGGGAGARDGAPCASS